MSLRQLDASTLVDRGELERRVQDVYRDVARDPVAPRHFEVGRSLALRLGYPEAVLDGVPYLALASFSGVGYHLDLAQLAPGDAVLDLGSGSGTDVFASALLVGPAGWVVGVDFTDAQLGVATSLARRHGVRYARFVRSTIDDLPFADASFDVVISNGVVNLSPVKQRVFAEAARVLKPGGRLALSDLVSETELGEATRRNPALWAACSAGAVPEATYLDALAAAGLEVTRTHPNPARFHTPRAPDACRAHGVRSLSIAARRQGEPR